MDTGCTGLTTVGVEAQESEPRRPQEYGNLSEFPGPRMQRTERRNIRSEKQDTRHIIRQYSHRYTADDCRVSLCNQAVSLIELPARFFGLTLRFVSSRHRDVECAFVITGGLAHRVPVIGLCVGEDT